MEVATKYLGFGHGDLSLAGSYIRQGKMVAFPTDVMYAMGANATSDPACERIYTTKGMPMTSPLIVQVWNKQQIYEIAKVSADAEKVIDHIMPANLTLLLPKKETLSVYVTGRLPTVAVRMPLSSEARKFLQYAEVPIATTGASLEGHANPTSWRKVKAEMGNSMGAILCGDDITAKGESTILDLAHGEPVVLRQGAVSIERLSEVLGKPVREVSDVAELVTLTGGKLKNFRTEKVQMTLQTGSTPAKLCSYYDGLVERGYNPVLLVEEASPAFGKRNVFAFGTDQTDLAFRLFDELRILEKRYNFIVANVSTDKGGAYAILNHIAKG